MSHGSHRYLNPRVGSDRLPAKKEKAAPLDERATQIRESRRRIREEHHTESRRDDVEFGTAEVVHLSIGLQEVGVDSGFQCSRTCSREHDGRDVEADN